MLKINVLTLFPEFFKSPLDSSIVSRAQSSQLVDYNLVNIREFCTDKHKKADDRPFGGGPGMVMKIEPIYKGLKSLKKSGLVILTSAKGQLFTQDMAQKWSGLKALTIICGHYEGVDERVAEHLVDHEVRIGNYVLTGGESAALVMLEAIVRLVPGALGNVKSSLNESHSFPGQLGYPQYTRPTNFKGWQVPKVLLSGNHREIDKWRQQQTTKIST